MQKLTTSHVVAGDIGNWKGCLLDILIHSHASAVALRCAIDEEIGKSRVCSHGTDDSSCKQQGLGEDAKHCEVCFETKVLS